MRWRTWNGCAVKDVESRPFCWHFFAGFCYAAAEVAFPRMAEGSRWPRLARGPHIVLSLVTVLAIHVANGFYLPGLAPVNYCKQEELGCKVRDLLTG